MRYGVKLLCIILSLNAVFFTSKFPPIRSRRSLRLSFINNSDWWWEYIVFLTGFFRYFFIFIFFPLFLAFPQFNFIVSLFVLQDICFLFQLFGSVFFSPPNRS